MPGKRPKVWKVTEKSNDTPKSEDPGAAEPPASAAGSPVTSPFDSPTQQMPKPDMSKGVPRTDDELGLDPDEDIPLAAAPPAGDAAADPPTENFSYASIPPAGAAGAGGAAAAGAAAGGAGGAAAASARLQRRPRETRRGTLDLGLLVLRLTIGGAFLYHGLQKLAGWFHGPGLDGTKAMMETGGWDHPSLATALVVAGEVGGGALLVLGLATPLAAGAVLATILDAWLWKQGMIPGFQFNNGVKTGVEYETILAGAAVAILLTGPGRLSLDRGRGWSTRPAYGSFLVLVLAVAAAIGTWWFLHGGNPLTGIGPW